MKSRIVIAFMSFLLISSIVAPSVFALIEVELQTALVDSTEVDEQKEAKEKELEEKKLISQFSKVDLNRYDNGRGTVNTLLLDAQFKWLREVLIPPPESLV